MKKSILIIIIIVLAIIMILGGFWGYKSQTKCLFCRQEIKNLEKAIDDLFQENEKLEQDNKKLQQEKKEDLYISFKGEHPRPYIVDKKTSEVAFCQEGKVFLLNLESSKIEQLAKTEENIDCESIAWSPDGQKLFFVFEDKYISPVEYSTECGFYKEGSFGSGIKEIDLKTKKISTIVVVSKEEFKKCFLRDAFSSLVCPEKKCSILSSLSISSNGENLAWSGNGINVTNLINKDTSKVLLEPGYYAPIEFSLDNNYLLFRQDFYEGGGAGVIDLKNKKLQRELKPGMVVGYYGFIDNNKIIGTDEIFDESGVGHDNIIISDIKDPNRDKAITIESGIFFPILNYTAQREFIFSLTSNFKDFSLHYIQYSDLKIKPYTLKDNEKIIYLLNNKEIWQIDNNKNQVKLYEGKVDKIAIRPVQ